MKKALCYVLAIVMLLGLAACAKTDNGQKTDDAGKNDVVDSGKQEENKADGETSTDANKEPLTVGLLCPYNIASGIQAKLAVEIALESVDYTVAGRKIEIRVEDDGQATDVTAQKLTKLVENEDIPLIIGPLGGSTGSTAKEFAATHDEATIVIGSCATDGVTKGDAPDNFFCYCPSGTQTAYAMGQYCYNELGYRKMITIASDYDFTFSLVNGFLLGFVGAGGEVDTRLWFHKSDTDFSSVIAQIPEDIDGIYLGIGAADSVNFMRQMNDFDMIGKIPLVGGSNLTDPNCIGSDIGYLYEGVLVAAQTAQDLPYAEYEEFNTLFKERAGYDAGAFAMEFYISTMCCIKALEAIDGDIENNQEGFRQALLELEFDGPTGKVSLDEYHRGIRDIFITEVTKAEDGTFYNRPIKTIEQVSQFVGFDEEWYLSQPDPDRVNPTLEAIAGAKRAN
ncbi:MAG: ABC transporter substrate-binding protein [Oscillospiraceae bacterium]